MAVYLCQAGTLPIVKIGKADNVPERIAQHQCAHWEELRLIRQWEGGLIEEALLHVRFADLRIRGEWFSFSQAMLGDVGLVEIALPASAKGSPTEAELQGMDPLSRYLAHRQLSVAAFAGLIGVREQSIYRYITRARTPRRDVIEKIAHASAGLVTANDFFAPSTPSHPEAA